MADKKISALTASTTPLAGTEVLPIVQGGATVKVAVSNLTAGRAISATELTLTTGNLIIGTSGKGIDFSATPGTGTSELLADYEEGIWTPVPTAPSGSFTTVTASGTYTKIGNMVRASFNIVLTNVGTATAMNFITGLPFTSNAGAWSSGALREFANTGLAWTLTLSSSQTAIYTINYLNAQTVTSGATFNGSIVYYV